MCASCERWLKDLPDRLERMAGDPEQLAAALKALAEEPDVLSMALQQAAVDREPATVGEGQS